MCIITDCQFNAMELEVLVVQANKHVVGLQQRNINTTQRNAMRESIREKLNAVGKTKKQPMKLRGDVRTWKNWS